jgi:hypothetical protein
MSKHFGIRTLLVVICVGLGLAVNPLPGEAVPSTPESPAGPKRNASGMTERYPLDIAPLQTGEFVQTEGVQLPSEGPTLNAGMEWAPLTYESYRDGNWEIYTAAGDGTNPVRLTYHAANDVQPRLSRGGGRIVFASDRSGNAEIFSMAANGSDVRQLTNHSAVDRNPTWSPDGAKIAFESNRNGQFEVYVMNADGSNPVRLTDSSGYDGQPTWSPDQSRIAFTSYRNGQWRIWAVNLDGSSLTQLSDRPYSENPAYSPDGRWLAYDADPNDDATMSLCVMPASGGACEYTFALAEKEDMLMRSFSPDSLSISYTQASWVYSSGEFFYTSSYLGKYAFYNWNIANLASSGADWNPDWQTLDIQAPQTSVNILQPFSRAGWIEIGWGGSDVGPAGIWDYDVQAKIGVDGTAQNLRSESTFTNALYKGVVGELAYFRSRARDHANNLESWPANWDTFTYFYQWLVDGKVTDAAGVEVSGVGINQTIVAYDNNPTKPDGTYERHLGGEGTLSVEVTSPSGFLQLPPAQRMILKDEKLDFTLLPLDNLIQNPMFDSAQVDPWQFNGTIGSRIDLENAHTGTGSVLLGATSEPTRVVEATELGSAPTMIKSPDGSIYLFRGLQTGYSYSRRSPEGVWEQPEVIVNTGDFFSPYIASDGTIHLIYRKDFTTLNYMFRKPGTGWSAPENVTEFLNGYIENSYTVDNQGTLHVVWGQNNYLFYNSRTATGEWGSAKIIRANAQSPLIKLMPDGSLYVTWAESNSATFTSYGMQRVIDGNWGSVEAISTGCHYAPPKKMLINTQGELVISYSCADLVFLNVRNSAGVWSQPENIEGDFELFPTYQLGFGSDGNLHLFWKEAGNLLAYKVRYPNGVWSATWHHPVVYAFIPIMEMDDDTADLVWFEYYDHPFQSADYDQWECRIESSYIGDSEMSQSFHIPNDMHQPWLSFAYRAQNGSYLQAEFTATVNGDIVFSTNEASNEWAYARADLSAYAGQDVTLAFHTTFEGAAVPLKVNIDEVSIGSWRTPVVSVAEPWRWESGVITIHGENFIATPLVYLGGNPLSNVTWIDANTLTAEVPLGTPMGRHQVRVMNPDGPASSQAVYIWLGKAVYLPVTWKP